VQLIVVDNPKTWRLRLPDVPIISARSYLTDPQYSRLRNAKVYNLCRSYRYQSAGYYVSLLAMARQHKPLPSITTIQDLKTLSITRVVADDLGALVQRSLKPLRSDEFTLSIYFGRNLARRYRELSERLFRLFPAPLLRAEFERRDGQWRLLSVHATSASEIPAHHADFVFAAAEAFFRRKRLPAVRRSRTRYDLAVLHDPAERLAPSNMEAMKKFETCARRAGLAVELIRREDYGRLPEFDGLFIRETTAVNHHTYRFARRAAAEGLVVIDDPDSIAQCANKVFLAELFARHRVPTPKTVIVHRENREQVAELVGLPCVLKQPDSSFSQGVVKASSGPELLATLDRLLDDSDLVLAQEFVETAYDWRIGVLAREPLFACKYHMVKEHWQIAQNDGNGRTRYGEVEPVTLEAVPPRVMDTAVRAARLIGDGLYGVDLKEIGRRVYLIEINDNPNLDAGNEDAILGDGLYQRLAQEFLTRIASRKNGLGRITA